VTDAQKDSHGAIANAAPAHGVGLRNTTCDYRLVNSRVS